MKIHHKLKEIIRDCAADPSHLSPEWKRALELIDADYRHRTEETPAGDVVFSRKIEDTLCDLFSCYHAFTDIIFLVDGADIIAEYSGMVDELYMKPEDFLGKKIGHLPLGEAGPVIADAIRRARILGSLQSVEYCLPVRGEECFYEARFFPRERGWVLVAVRNITDERRALLDLSASEERFRLLVETTSDIIYTLDNRGTITYVSPRFEELSGHAVSEFLGHNFTEFLSQEELPHIIALFQRGMKGETTSLYEINLRFSNGDVFPLELNVNTIFNSGGTAVGRLGVARDIRERKKTEQALRKRTEIIEKDLATAQLIQKAFITSSLPRYEGIRIGYRYLPLEAVGGDYFSVNRLYEGGLGVFVGDVTSHGVTAALFLSLVKATTDRICRKHPHDPGEYIRELNRKLLHNMPYSYLTAIYGVFQESREEGDIRFTFSDAGHPYPLLYRRGEGDVMTLENRGRILGMLREVRNGVQSVNLQKGDRIFLYTDGIPETMNSRGELLGMENLPALFREASRDSLEDTLDAVMGRLDRFRGERPYGDDIVLLGFEVE